jgi:hypothetical protein
MLHELIRNANVVASVVSKDDKAQAHIVVNDKYEHTFPRTSRVSKHLDTMTPEMLSKRLSGGNFYFVEDTLVDWRDGQYDGFIHEDKTIQLYMDIIGCQKGSEITLRHRRTKPDDIVLRKPWDHQHIEVPGYANDSGKFQSVLNYQWSPFTHHVDSSFDIVRQICTNGMIGVASFLNTKIPLYNKEVEHLHIGAMQIQSKIDRIVVDRLQIMRGQAASLGDALLLESHIRERMMNTIDSSEYDRLKNLYELVSPVMHLSHVYRPSVFDDKMRAKMLPSHLSQVALFNMTTEARTYTAQTHKSSNFGLDKLSNDLLFFNGEQDRVVAKSSSNTDYFADTDRAFYGIAA